MFISILLDVTAPRRRNFVWHSDWIFRGYVIGMDAATQVLTQMAGH